MARFSCKAFVRRIADSVMPKPKIDYIVVDLCGLYLVGYDFRNGTAWSRDRKEAATFASVEHAKTYLMSHYVNKAAMVYEVRKEIFRKAKVKVAPDGSWKGYPDGLEKMM